jgi:uncharacterized protein (DUF1800 family)
MIQQAPHASLVAVHRFGYGARRDGPSVRQISADPRGFVKADLERPDAGRMQVTGLVESRHHLQDLYSFQDGVRRARTAEGVEEPDNGFIASAFRSEAYARFRMQFSAEVGFAERLVAFWSNHFSVSVAKGQFVRMTAGAFEREAIRPHVLGRFSDMLLAVEKHPAMLQYLDNTLSVGPGSRAGRNNRRGLNENLAREILELHTLGVDGGYSQDDVTSLARIITGWTTSGRQGALAEPGVFVFNPAAHEPGVHRVLGRAYAEPGVAQGEAALADLARHPSTARFVAFKLARHFVADTPPPAVVRRLERVFLETEGDLRELAHALVSSEEAWTAPLTKIRTPQEFLIAAVRLSGRLPDNVQQLLAPAAQLGQPLWQPPGPNGFPDTAAEWGSPEGIKTRLEIAAQYARRIPDIDPAALIETAFGDAASPETREALRRAETRQQALALLLMSPEFQRR